MTDHADVIALLADLRAQGVRQAVFAAGKLQMVQFFPAGPTPIAEEDRPAPKPPRTMEDRLLKPLGIGKAGA
ncbi:MAG: hypothetical protein LC640_09230 [Frankia sp.]|nr:hypothetical protein [Frankia sp.]